MKPLTPKEQKILNFIRSYSTEHGFPPTYLEIQEEFQYKAISSVQQFVEQLVNKSYLKAPLGEGKKRALELASNTSSGLVSIPMEGRVAAGKLTEAVQSREHIDVPKSLLKEGSDYFALRVKGDSMIGDCILDGDTVIIRRQHNAHDGQTVVALVNDEATIKRFYHRKSHIELHPANPNFDVIRVHDDAEFKILGVLSSIIRSFDR